MPNSNKLFKMPKKPRQAKVITHRSSKSTVHLRSMTVSSIFENRTNCALNKRTIPFIHLKGRWLEEAGFSIQSKIDVIVDENLIVIKPVGMG